MTARRRLRTPKTTLALAATALLGGLAPLPASAATCSWNTTSGNWNAFVNWLNCATGNGNPAGVPGGADTAVIGAGGNVTVSNAQAINTLNNAGVVNVNNSVAFSLDARSTGASFTGGGQIVLGGTGSRLYVEGGNGVTVGAGSTIRGAGQIGQAVSQSGASLFTNAGTISADSNGNDLSLLNPGNSGSYLNNGLMEARNGGRLELNSSVAQGATGQMRAENGSAVLISGGSITGGLVGTTGTGRIRATNNSVNVLSAVTLAGTVDLASAASQLRIVDGLSFSNGSIDIGGSILYLDNRSIATQALSGTGSLVLAGGALRMEGSGQTTTGANVTVRGHGTIGQATLQGGNHTWINNGMVSADVNGQTLNLVQPGNSGVPIQNNGILEAKNGGRLLLSADVAAAPGSQMRAGAGSVIEMNGVRVTGAVNTTGTGSFRASNSFANGLSGVTLNGTVDLASQASQLRVSEGLVLNGAIDVGGSVLYLDSRNTASQAITGTGTVHLDGGALRMEGSGQTTTGANITVRGWGSVGQATSVSGNHTWINNGLVSADVGGQTLNLMPVANLGQPIQNNGILEAKGGGRLLLSTDVAAATGSQLRADAGSVIEMNGVRVTGTVNTTGSGSFRASNNFANLLSGVTLNGTMDLASQPSQLRISDSLVLNGTLDVGNAVAYLDNRVTDTQTVTGAGSIRLAGGALRMEGTGQTTTGANIVIRGHGTVGQATSQSGQYVWVNQGLVSADVGGQTLNLVNPANGGQPIQNQGIFEAINGARLLLSADVTATPTAQMRAGAGSVIEMNGVRVTGTVNTTGTGSFRASNSFANVLSGVTLNGSMDLASQPSQLRISEGLALNGGIDVGGAAVYLDNRFTATQAITGTGSITLGGGALRMEGNGQTTTGAGVSIVGHGTVGQATNQTGAYTWINNGLVSANVNGETLNLVPPANGAQPIQNNGTMRAANGGTLQLSASIANGAGSRYDVDTGSRILMNGVTLSGVVNQTGSGAIDVSNNFANALTASTLTGRVNVGTGGASQLRVTDGLAMNGGATVAVGGSGVLSFDNRATAAQAVSGNGQIVMTNGTLRFEGGSSTTWGSGVTVRGSGTIGQATSQSANHTLFNNGTLVADGGTLSIIPIANQGALQGTGTLRVDGGTLSLGTGKTTNQGTLDIRGTGTLALGTQNLVLSADYTNAQAGSGNAFNRRAGVTGTGQIQAGGDVQQVISGANVTGGNTANATLTIGNVRVGANLFDYTIGAGGTTGPALRGAVQTAANGGNVSDARLSGSGVTAGNYNAGAPGGSGETRTVGFTVGGAGALAPMSGQVINLRSAYDNIGDQKLAIVLASGAAAYNAAVGSATSPAQVANQRVGGSNTTTLAIANTAAPGAFSEDLNVGIASTGGQASASGGISGRLAGTGNTGTGAITAGVDTSTAGAKTGVVNLNYVSTGTVNGVSKGLGAIGVGGQTVTVNGNVYQAASGQLLSAPLNFGTVQVGQSVVRDIVVRNSATGASGFVEDLNVAFGAKTGTGTALFNGTGSLDGIRAGATSNAGNGSMQVVVNTANAGSINGSIAINYVSAGAVNGVDNGLGTLAVGSDSLGVAGTIDAQANVVNQASPQFGTTSVNLGAVRVGAAAPTAAVLLSNQAVGGDQAALSATIASNGAPVTASGAVNLLAPGASSSALQVGLNTAVAGNFTGANAGSATVSLVSDASNVGNCAPNCALNLASQQITVQGKVYTTAVGQASGGPIDFGIVRVGDTVSARQITITNAAAVTALNDTLRASASGLSGPVTSGSPVTGLGAGDSANLAVMLSTASAGTVNQTAQVSFLSQNPDLADVSAGPDAAIQVMATINNLANADFDLLSALGTLSDDGNGHYVLNLGNVNLGDARTLLLQLDNDVAGPADHLRGSFGLAGVDDFTLGGFGDVTDLAGGAVQGGLSVGFMATAVGLYSDTIDFTGRSFNTSDTQGLAQNRSLRIVANVVDPNGGGTVPVPGTLALVLVAALAAAARKRRSH